MSGPFESTVWGSELLDDPDNPRVSQPFEFPFDKGYPVRDEVAGIAFGDGGLKGSFHAGVLHALVMTGYLPRTIAGTSIGCMSGTVLACAAELDSQHERRALIERYLRVWLEEDPGAKLWSSLFDRGAPLRTLWDTLLDVPGSLDEVARAAHAIVPAPGAFDRLEAARWGLKAFARLPAKRWFTLPYALARHCVRQAFRPDGRVFDGTLAEALFPDGWWDGLQVALDGFGMRDSLTQKTLDESPFAGFFRAALPAFETRAMGDFKRSRLVFEVANVSSFDDALRAPRLVRLDGRARLWPSLRAACALIPVFRAERMRDVFPDGACLPGSRPDDQLVDGSVVQCAPLSPVIAAWKSATQGRDPWALPSHRLFAVYLGPREDTAAQRAPDDSHPPLVAGGLRSLRLLGQGDLQFNARVVSLITQMVRVIRRSVTPSTDRDRDMLLDSRGLPFIPVDITSIAPDDLLPMEQISAPLPDDHARAVASGCRATLEAVHQHTLRAMGRARGEDTLPCDDLLVTLAKKGIPREEGYLTPVASACAGCSKRLTVRWIEPDKRPTVDEPPVPFEPLSASATEGAPLDVAVPAGGVFRGVFQVGAIAGFRAYHIAPKLYAGASVGTLFSYVLEAANRDEAKLFEAARRMQDIPAWVDRAADGSLRFETLRDRLTAWWQESSSLRALPPRAVFDAFAREAPTPAWDTVARALGLRGDRREFYRSRLHALVRGRLPEAVDLFDERFAAWRVANHEAPSGIPEVIGLDGVARVIDALAFDDLPRDTRERLNIDAYARKRGCRFLFTVTDFDRGTLLHLGAKPNRVRDDDAETHWPGALEASLAASSFPIAFRLRTQFELFGAKPAKPGALGALYADGGILNNFASDSAFAYLRSLAEKPDYEWLDEVRHRVLLLSLTEPPSAPRGDPRDDGLVSVVRRWLITAENEKVHRTLSTQREINRLARHANPLFRAERNALREAGYTERALRDLRPAIQVNFVHIVPAQPGYPHFFAYKPELGFDLDKQNDAIASGCRRTRLALERERARTRPATFGDFEARVRAEIEAEVRAGCHCVLGTFTPRGEREPCTFRGSHDIDGIYRRCLATALQDEATPDLVGFYATPEEAPSAAVLDAARAIRRDLKDRVRSRVP